MKKNGYTLVELLAVLAIMGLIISMGMGVFSQSMKTWGSGQSSSEIQQHLRHALQTLCEDIRTASSALLSAGSFIPVGSTVTYQATDARKLQIPALKVENDVTVEYLIEYSIDSENILRRSINNSNNNLGKPFALLTITTVSVTDRGATYAITLSTTEIEGSYPVPSMEMQTTVFAPNITP